jgi:hypothetical protein
MMCKVGARALWETKKRLNLNTCNLIDTRMAYNPGADRASGHLLCICLSLLPNCGNMFPYLCLLAWRASSPRSDETPTSSPSGTTTSFSRPAPIHLVGLAQVSFDLLHEMRWLRGTPVMIHTVPTPKVRLRKREMNEASALYAL